MALVQLNGLVQGKHDAEGAAPRNGALDTAVINYDEHGTPVYAKVVVEETDEKGRVIGFFPVTANGEAAAAIKEAQWKRAVINCSAYKTRSGDWNLSVISVKIAE